MITQKITNEFFNYQNGKLFWKVDRGSNKIKGTEVGSINADGYLKTTINKKHQLVHRIIFMMHYGYLPLFLDHIDGNKLNNRIENLRVASSAENNWNRKLSTRNKSGFKNVHWHQKLKKWRVTLRINGLPHHFGCFDDLEFADLVASEARHKYFANFANNG